MKFQSLGNVASIIGRLMEKNVVPIKTAMSNKQNKGISEINIYDPILANQLYIDRNHNLTIRSNKVYSLMTDYGYVNYHLINDNGYNYVKIDHFDHEVSDEQRVHLERKGQFLNELQWFAEFRDLNVFSVFFEADEILKEFQQFGINPNEHFTINNRSTRYRIDTNGVIYNVDLESKSTREIDWRIFGYDEHSVFIVQGTEYRIGEDGKLPLPKDYVHKHEEFEITGGPTSKNFTSNILN
ncbi:hypothetical protein [Lysinibacillus sp. LZ02]|uniref:hypothetical protein n=1 Tax=Lysinibacillus sp. LZ02 TaxID=3420668 RepID=UPI003D367F3B